MILEVSTTIFTDLINQIRNEYPNEACGLLFGLIQDTNTQFIVQEMQKFVNIAENPKKTFLIDPEKVYQSINKYEEEKRCLVCIYHSHRAPPVLSQTDLQFIQGYPDVVWLIFSTLNGTRDVSHAAFVLKQDRIIPVTIQIV